MCKPEDKQIISIRVHQQECAFATILSVADLVFETIACVTFAKLVSQLCERLNSAGSLPERHLLRLYVRQAMQAAPAVQPGQAAPVAQANQASRAAQVHRKGQASQAS